MRRSASRGLEAAPADRWTRPAARARRRNEGRGRRGRRQHHAPVTHRVDLPSLRHRPDAGRHRGQSSGASVRWPCARPWACPGLTSRPDSKRSGRFSRNSRWVRRRTSPSFSPFAQHHFRAAHVSSFRVRGALWARTSWRSPKPPLVRSGFRTIANGIRHRTCDSRSAGCEGIKVARGARRYGPGPLVRSSGTHGLRGAPPPGPTSVRTSLPQPPTISEAANSAEERAMRRSISTSVAVKRSIESPRSQSISAST